MREQTRHQTILLAVGLVLFLTNLGLPRLWDDDEAFFAQVAYEMDQRGDYVVPYFNDEIFAHKPAMMYWLMIAAFKVFGATEFAARVPSALVGLGTLLLTYQLGRRMFSAAAGFWSGIILASCLNFDLISRAATPDSELIFFCTLPLLIFISGTAVRRVSKEATGNSETIWPEGQMTWPPNWSTFALTYAAMGLAVLTKGPIGVLLPTSVLVLFSVWVRDAEEKADVRAYGTVLSLFLGSLGLAISVKHPICMGLFFAVLVVFAFWICIPVQKPVDIGTATFIHRLRWTVRALFGTTVRTIWSLRPLTALAVVLLVAGPWFLWVEMRTNFEFGKGFYGTHNIGRFWSAMESHWGPPIFYYFLVICIGFFPWSVFMFPSIGQMYKRIRDHHEWRPGYILISCWIAVWVGFFSLASTKLPNYVLPCYPALALFTGALIAEWLRQPAALARGWQRSACITTTFVGAGILVIVPIVARIYLGGDFILGLVGLPLLIAGPICLYLTEHNRTRPALITFTVAGMVFVTSLFGFAAIRVDKYQNSELVAELVKRHSPHEKPFLATYIYFRPSLVCYCRQRVEDIERNEDIREFFATHRRNAYLITTEEGARKLANDLPVGVTVLERETQFLKPKQNIVMLGWSKDVALASHVVSKDERGQVIQASATAD